MEWIDEDEEDIRLIDFGVGFAKGSEPDQLAQTLDLRAPETIFGDSIDHKVDLWHAGVTIYSILFGSRPFHYWGAPTDNMAHQMIGFVDDVPSEWQQQWELMQKAAGEVEEYPATSSKPVLSKLEQRFKARIRNPHLQPLLPVIRGLARFRPSDRITAAEALEMIDIDVEWDEWDDWDDWDEEY